MDSARWRRLKQRAADAHLTPSAVLLSVWSTVLAAWSAQPDFTLNLTLFDRRPLHPQINQITGDFTSLMLLSWHPGESWLQSARLLQQRLSESLNHRDVSAIRVMRQLARRQNVPAVPMPVVFTSALGFEQDNFLARRNLLKPVWGYPRRRRSGSITVFMNPKANCALTGILSPPCFLTGRWSASLHSIARCLTEWRRMTAAGSCRSPSWFPA